MNDVYGKALLDYLGGKKNAKIKVESDVAETEYWPVSEFFHSENDMCQIEKKALTECRGKILDVGAGSGSHVLWLQDHGAMVEAIDTSEGAVEVMRKRGVRRADVADFYQLSGRRYDTLLMLMNGMGIAQSMDNMPRFFAKVKELLNPGGQLVCDSADLLPLFVDEDGSAMIDLNGGYYGELCYVMSYGKQRGDEFGWIFIDFDTLQMVAAENGMKAEKIMDDDNNQYLVRLTVM